MKIQRRLISILVLVMMIISNIIPSFAFGAQNNNSNKSVSEAKSASAEEAIKSITAITDTVMVGQKLKGVAVEYDGLIAEDGISVDTYEIKSLYNDGKTMKAATITKVYTNNKAEMREDGQSVPGKYVIIETDDKDNVGLMVNKVYYKSKTGDIVPKDYGMIYDVPATVCQKQNIKTMGNKLILSSDKEISKTETINLNYDEFKDLVLDSETGKVGDKKIKIKYYLPKGYNESNKGYPMVVVQCGGGLRLWEVETQDGTLDNYGANIAFDTSATSWINNGYEDVIIVSVDNRNIIDSDGSKTPYYRAADDINQTVEYFIDKYNVDTNRIYYSGNSQGSLIGYQTVGSRPDLWAAFMPCNGLSHFGDITTVEGLALYKQGIENSMTPMAQSKIAMLWQLGRYDAGASGEKGQLFYDFMFDYYKKAGMTDDEINKILQLNIYEEAEYLKLGILTPSGGANFHGATKLVYTAHRDEFMPWLLSQSKVANNDLINGVVSTKAITDSTVMGQKLSAVVVEYGKHVDASKLTKSSFTVKDRYYDLTFKEATITAVYTNDEPKMREDKTSVKGKYVIIETDAFDRVGYMGTTYIDPKTGVQEPYWLKPDVETTVRQNIDIVKDKDKEILAKANDAWMKMTEKTTQLKFEEFNTITIKSDINMNGNDEPLDILSWYYLPEGYDKSDKKYPIVFVECGAGLRYWEKVNSLGETINNAGACIAFDQSATAWIRNKYEDVIVVSVNYRGKYAPAGYSAPQDVNQVAKYFIDNFNVDANRVYYSGNSAGSVLGYDTINDNPKLWAAFMPCNGIWVKTEEGANATMKAFAENDVAVIWQSGEDDKAATRAETEMYYDVTKQLFMDNGYSEKEAESMVEKRIWVKQDYYDAKILTDAGAYNPHLATKLAYTIDRDFFMPWILGQSK